MALSQSTGDRKMVRVLKALADPKRFQMLKEIAAAGELSCSQIGKRFLLAQPTISHHLKILHDASVLEVREEGQHHFISVNQPLVRHILEMLPKRLINRRSARTRRIQGTSLRKAPVQGKKK
ncbi:MAG: helix-turn-helix transcriptional regulator [Acidobacteria bacterium]|nr:helix-turn-helix transcriptional regulator [Acidobacteriota bacterium]